MRYYELTIIQDGNATKSKQRELIKVVKEAVKHRSGEVVEYEDDGVKTLPYEITIQGTTYKRGHYHFMLIKFLNDHAGATSLANYLNTYPDVLRYLLVLRDPKYAPKEES